MQLWLSQKRMVQLARRGGLACQHATWHKFSCDGDSQCNGDIQCNGDNQCNSDKIASPMNSHRKPSCCVGADTVFDANSMPHNCSIGCNNRFLPSTTKTGAIKVSVSCSQHIMLTVQSWCLFQNLAIVIEAEFMEDAHSFYLPNGKFLAGPKFHCLSISRRQLMRKPLS